MNQEALVRHLFAPGVYALEFERKRAGAATLPTATTTTTNNNTNNTAGDAGMMIMLARGVAEQLRRRLTGSLLTEFGRSM